MIIKRIFSRQIFDSRGRPTIETDLEIEGGFIGRAAVPSGASKGSFEAVEFRDGGQDYNGLGVLGAVKKINEVLGAVLLERKFETQEQFDQALLDLDGTVNKSNLGANTILSLSLGFAYVKA